MTDATVSHRLDALRRSFAAASGVALLAGLLAGLAMPSVDDWLDVDFPLVNLREDAASSLLETVATVVMSVVGISFSVVVVALQLASQQLSPRVLRTFQTDRLSQLVLALFLGTFVYCLAVLARLGSVDRIPELSVAVAIVLALVAFAIFVAFINRIVNTIQASSVIDRIADDGRHALRRRFPRDLGAEPQDRALAARRAEARMAASAPVPIEAATGGYVTAVAAGIVDDARDHGALVRQVVPIGDFALTGSPLAEAWLPDGEEGFADTVRTAFTLAPERTIVQDVAFPVRQLADVALRALSPGINDPTTAENALNFVTDILVRYVDDGASAFPIRVDVDGEPRFVAVAPSLDDLVRLGFEEVRVAATEQPVLAGRLASLLGGLEERANRAGVACDEPRRQAELLARLADRGARAVPA